MQSKDHWSDVFLLQMSINNVPHTPDAVLNISAWFVFINILKVITTMSEALKNGIV